MHGALLYITQAGVGCNRNSCRGGRLALTCRVHLRERLSGIENPASVIYRDLVCPRVLCFVLSPHTARISKYP